MGQQLTRSECERLIAQAYEVARRELFARQVEGHWEGRLADSPLATAVAVSALAVYYRARSGRIFAKGPTSVRSADSGIGAAGEDLVPASAEIPEPDAGLIARGLDYLFATQHRDGGWGDTDADPSNIAATALAMAALRLTWGTERHEQAWPLAEGYFRRQGGVDGILARYGADKTFAAPILATCAVAGIVPWECVPQLPFELAWLPQRWLGAAGLPVVSYALPALVAIGQLRFWAGGGGNWPVGLIRRAASRPTLRKLPCLQPPSGGFLEAVPLTAFVVLSLAGIGLCEHPVVLNGIRFLRHMARANGAWPVDVNLAHWLSSLAASALSHFSPQDLERINWEWILSCQHRKSHPFTASPPGGWGWTDRPGAVPDVDDTSAALLALAVRRGRVSELRSATVCEKNLGGLLDREALRSDFSALDAAAYQGLQWLLNLQNPDGGWPTFCKGWGKLPFDRSAVDLTAHAVRAITAWLRLIRGTPARPAIGSESAGRASPNVVGETGSWRNCASLTIRPVFEGVLSSRQVEVLGARLEAAVKRGVAFLRKHQRSDGSWIPLWFGNPYLPEEVNPIFGTSRALLALLEVMPADSGPVRAGVDFLVRTQHSAGGWGVYMPVAGREGSTPGAPAHQPGKFSEKEVGGPEGQGFWQHRQSEELTCRSATGSQNDEPTLGPGLKDEVLAEGRPTIEETAWAVEALAAFAKSTAHPWPEVEDALLRGATFLASEFLSGGWKAPAPVGLYFARLWYYEELYPLVFGLAALGRALCWLASR
ncbi:MAG: hypothetical protein NZ899_04650 [Thermoguttaceae bacterium]|nr:hypothetical protein [Thermoguttaceae bacterium]MDW8077876.1 prenyltransferase/squalene oxidase repeat-containing protein [Thermoguttaceae bacterium]